MPLVVYNIMIFAPSGAQGMQICVHLSGQSLPRALNLCLIFLAQIFKLWFQLISSLPALSQVSYI